MLAIPPPPARSFYLVMTVASLLVGGAIGAQFAPQRAPEPTPPAQIEITTPAPVPELHFAEPPPPAPPAPPMGECDLYVARIRQLAYCETFPQEARDAMLQSVEQLEASFRDMTPEVRKQTAVGCRQANEAIDQAAESIGCAITRP